MIDVGLAGVIGADRLAKGEDIYGEGASWGCRSAATSTGRSTTSPTCRSSRHSRGAGSWDEVSAARAASLGFELLTALALFGLGRRVRAGPRARPSASPWRTPGWPTRSRCTRSARASTTGLVALLVVCCLLVLSSAPARGAASALAGLTQVRAADAGASVRGRSRGAAGAAADPLHARLPRDRGARDHSAASRRRLPRAL